MTEQVPSHGREQLADEPAVDHAREDQATGVELPPGEPGRETNDEPVRTGVAPVDDVLSEIDQLDDLPLEQHLAAFERTHGVLRSALDAEPGDPA